MAIASNFSLNDKGMLVTIVQVCVQYTVSVYCLCCLKHFAHFLVIIFKDGSLMLSNVLYMFYTIMLC